MRIISGKFRGTVIPSPKQEVVKPTLDRVKENIFNILQFKIAGANCLDLFCGSGALGIECLSRGADKVQFVDNNKANVEALKAFLKKLSVQNYSATVCDYYDALKSFAEKGEKFDIIFLDPPFDSDLADVAISKMLKFDLLADNGVIVHERSSTKPSKFAQKVFDSRKYGTVAVDFLKK
ncbi:MAG: 16S rRNA (guanine(966)-N(2))-methyltransferase RsmD [Christensenellales bacterium]